MTFDKMRRMMLMLAHVEQAGHVSCTAGGELAFDFTSQPEPRLVRFLTSKGFVKQEDPSRYVYRPRIRSGPGPADRRCHAS